MKRAVECLVKEESKFLSLVVTWMVDYSSKRAILPLKGVFGGLKSVDFDIISMYQLEFQNITKMYLSPEFASNSLLIDCYFDSMRFVLSRVMSKYDAFDQFWEDLLLGVANSSNVGTKLQEFVVELVSLIWDKEFRLQLINCGNDIDLSRIFVNSMVISPN